MRAGTKCAFFGRSTLDLLYRTPQFPAEDTKIWATSFLAQAGGPALNAAITFAFLGGASHLISAVGRGAWSPVLKVELERYGVALTDLSDAKSFAPPVSSVVINTASGSRTIFNAPAMLPQRGEQVRLPMPAARLLLIDGFYISEGGSFLREFAAGGGALCLDGGSWKPELKGLLPLIAIAICSERFRPPGIHRDEDTLEYLTSLGIRWAAITRGASDILASDRGRKYSIPIEAVSAVDTLGAGDILHGAFCWYYLRGGSFEESLRAASQIATLSVRFFGAREWMVHFRSQNH